MAKTKSTTKKKAGAKKPVTSSAKKTTTKVASKPVTHSSENAGKKSGKKSKVGLICGIVIAIILVIVGVVIAILYLNRTNPSDPTAKLDYSKSFFVYDNGNYSLWNKDGVRLTEDEYQSQSDFVGGYALVEKNDQYGIINENGILSVNYGKYGSIRERGGLYLAEDGNTKEQFLITGSGDVLEKGEELDVESTSDAAGFAVVISDDKLKVYNYNGNLILETAKLGNEEEPEMKSSHDYGILHYDNNNWVFDARDGKVIAAFDGKFYGFDSVSEDRSMILLDEYEDSEDYKLITNSKLYDLNETKYYGLTDNNQVIGYDDYDELALLGDDYKIVRRVNTLVQLKDTNNFAEEKEDGGVVIYQNGQVVKEFDEDAGIPVSGLVYNDYYAISNGDKIKFYNLDGTTVFDKEFEDVDLLSDKNHHSIVSENGDDYYLMDAKGNRIGDITATNIKASKAGYRARNNDGKYALLDKDGNQVTDFKYTDLYYRSSAEPRNIWTAKLEDGNTDVIDVDNHKVIAENVSIDDFYDNYFSVKNESGDIDNYTFDGKLFYTEKK